MAGVFSKQRFGFASGTTIEQLKIIPKTRTQLRLPLSGLLCGKRGVKRKISLTESRKTSQKNWTNYTKHSTLKWKTKNGDDCETDNVCTMRLLAYKKWEQVHELQCKKNNSQQTEESWLSDIVKVTGHRSVQYLDDYDEADEEVHRRLSVAISKRNYENPCADKKRIAVSYITIDALYSLINKW